MSPKVVDKDQRRREIAKQALPLFAERGFESASLSQIAEAAGLKKATLYEYFSSKEEIIQASLVFWMEEMTVGLEAVIADIADPGEKLRTVAHASLAFVEQDPLAIQMIIATTQLFLQNPLHSYDFVRDGFSRFLKEIVSILLGGIESGHFDSEISPHVEKIAINFLAYLDGIGLHYYFGGGLIQLREQIDSYVDGLLCQLGAKTP